MTTENKIALPAPKGNGNVTVTPKAAKPAKVATTRSSTPMPVIKAKAPKLSRTQKEKNRLAEIGLTPAKTIAFKPSEMVAMDSATASRNILQLRSIGSKAKALAHKTACGILLHYVATGDWSKMTALHEVIGEVYGGAKQRAFRDWVGCFSTVKYDDKKKTFFDSVKGQGADAKRFTLAAIDGATADSDTSDKGALNQPFYSGAFGDQPDHVFDFESYMAGVVKRLTREMELRAELIAKKQKAKANKIDIDEKRVNAVLGLAKTLHIPLETAKPAGNA